MYCILLLHSVCLLAKLLMTTERRKTSSERERNVAMCQKLCRDREIKEGSVKMFTKESSIMGGERNHSRFLRKKEVKQDNLKEKNVGGR